MLERSESRGLLGFLNPRRLIEERRKRRQEKEILERLSGVVGKYGVPRFTMSKGLAIDSVPI